MLTQVSEIKRGIAVRMNRGDDVLECIDAAAKEHGIVNGLVTMGIGAVERYHGHVFDADAQDMGTMAILSLTGIIVDGRLHVHMTFGNGDRIMGGHVMEGTLVGIFAAVVIAETPEMDLSDWDVVD